MSIVEKCLLAVMISGVVMVYLSEKYRDKTDAHRQRRWLLAIVGGGCVTGALLVNMYIKT